MKNKDIITILVDELNELKLFNMAATLEGISRSKNFNPSDGIALLQEVIDSEFEPKMSKRLKDRLEKGHLKGCAETMDQCVDSADREYLPTEITHTLAELDFVKDGLNVCILGPSDIGKSYLARALGAHACTKYRVEYYHCEKLLEELVSKKSKDFEKYQKRIRHLINLDLLILDDFLLHTIMDEREVKVLFEIMETRNELQRSIIVCSQREPVSWPSMILNDAVAADAIKKRAVKHFTVVIKPRD